MQIEQVDRKIAFTIDLDGVLFNAPPPLATLIQLCRRSLILPQGSQEYTQSQLPARGRSSWQSLWLALTHSIRLAKTGDLETLREVKNLSLIHQRNIEFIALSGREEATHQLTKNSLYDKGYMDYFSQLLLLNTNVSSIVWKEYHIRSLVSQGYSVIHLEDDLRAALSTARVNNQSDGQYNVLVYLFRNISNHPCLLRWAGISIPENIIPVRNFQELILDFQKKLATKKI